MEENALVSQPWVGMMDGVAASRAECTGEAVRGFLERRGQQVGPADQRVEIHPDLAGAAHRAAGVHASDAGGQRRAADAGGLHLGIDRLEVGEDSDAGVALARCG